MNYKFLIVSAFSSAEFGLNYITKWYKFFMMLQLKQKSPALQGFKKIIE